MRLVQRWIWSTMIRTNWSSLRDNGNYVYVKDSTEFFWICVDAYTFPMVQYTISICVWHVLCIIHCFDYWSIVDCTRFQSLDSIYHYEGQITIETRHFSSDKQCKSGQETSTRMGKAVVLWTLNFFLKPFFWALPKSMKLRLHSRECGKIPFF